MLEKVMVFERKYRPEGVSVTQTVLNYLRKIKTLEPEEFVAQRVNIYSLLSSEGSRRAETALIEQLDETDLSDAERRVVMLAIALLPTPSSQVIQTIEDMITETTSSLLLAYGSLVANAAPDQEMKMVTFLTDRLTENNTDTLIHVLHALGNTKSSLAIEHIIPYVHYDDKDVRLTAVSALRFFTGLPIVQQQFVSILHEESSDSLVEAIIQALRNGYDYDKDIELDSDLVRCLVQVTNDLRNSYLQNQLNHLFKKMGVPTSSSANLMDNRNMSRQRRDTERWDSTASEYNIIASASQRANDVANYPHHRGYLWSTTIGQSSGEYPIYLQAAAGLFAGANIDQCELKMFGKAVVDVHVLGREGNILTIEGRKDRIYILFAGDIVFDINPPDSYSDQFPGYQITLFSASFTFFVYGVPITLGLDVHVSIGANIDISVQQGVSNDIEASAAIAPYVSASFDGSLTVSALVAKVGVSVTASIPYGITLRVTFHVCTPTDSDVNNSACVEASHGWQDIDITFAAFYQLVDIFSFGYGDRIIWDSLTYTYTIPAEQESTIYSDCVVASPATSAPPTSAPPTSVVPSAAAASNAVATLIPPFLVPFLLMFPLLVYLG
jgi:hypothetical protein